MTDDNQMAEFTMTAGNPWVRNDGLALERLKLVGVPIGAEEVATWSDDNLKAAEVWAWNQHMAATTDAITWPARPGFVPEPIVGEVAS